MKGIGGTIGSAVCNRWRSMSGHGSTVLAARFQYARSE
jgi:hypothetical protein